MRIKFITLNIWDGGNLLDNIIAFIRKEAPDIVSFQEVYNGKNPAFEKKFRTMEVFRKELGFPYSVFFPAFIDTREIGDIERGNAIFSKYPIVSQKTIFFDVPFGPFNGEGATNWQFEPMNTAHIVTTVGKTPLHVFNIHGIWGFDGGDNQRRLQMSKTIINQIKDKEHLVLAGDFNVRPNTKTIQNIEKYLKNVFKDELTTTFNMKRKSGGDYATAAVDMIFVSEDIEVLDRFCPQVDISDHLPLVCKFEI